jgi:hypothetical protein
MDKGDLSNEVIPRILLVFEGVVGWLPPENKKTYDKLVRKGQWYYAVYEWELNDLMLRKIWDVMFRQSRELDIITYIGGQPFADALAARLDEEDVPVRRVWYTTPAILSRKIALMPDVAAVFDPDPAHQFTYGGKGRVITSPHDL